MAKSRSRRYGTLKPRGSARKRRARTDGEVLDPKDWKVGMIAWNRDGNIVILDPALGRRLRAKAIEDGKFAMGVSPVAVSVGGSEDGRAAALTDPVGSPSPGVRPINALCVCDFLRFRFQEELPAVTKLLSDERVR